MRYSILASGSTGNALVVGTSRAHLLVDAGLSGKQIEAALQEVRISPASLDAILITHEHADHVKGVGVLARRYNLPVYANAATWEALGDALGPLRPEQRRVFETGEVLQFGDLFVESYGVSHDAAEPVGFCFYHGEQKLSLTTDLGYVSSRIKEKVAGSDVYIFEANHDVEMLRMGPYPWSVKRRILSDVGHLSNDDCGEALAEIIGGERPKVYLAHLSRDNNLMELARLTVQAILEENGLRVGEDLTLHDTYFDRPTRLDDLGEAPAARP
ncbi:MBL fold metallo-hydrolase [Calditerricola satsumensis]|uniref:MBL fold hydrolase n=1 Tax=Calditerricola satsumensis TaxID=373054 RepID=A0A8J3B983_9BACI|nr:MBL fold metallo-hydrolase [Calditerricola satsumensis]GGJ97126.1 MBL fold hydrolase [Calditerricola satsumensis]